MPARDGNTVVEPVVLSASRATDIPAFYADWFMRRLRAGFFRWANPFNAAQVQTVSVAKTRAIVFWTKDPAGIGPHLDELDRRGLHYYFQYTLNDYEAEGLEPGLPPLAARIDSFWRLADRLGPDRVIWRLDPLLLTDRLGVPEWLDRTARLMAQLARHTRKLVFSFADIAAYPAVRRNLARAGIAAREFAPAEMEEFARGLAALNRAHGLALAPARRKSTWPRTASRTTVAWTASCWRGWDPATRRCWNSWARARRGRIRASGARAGASPARTSGATARARTAASTATQTFRAPRRNGISARTVRKTKRSDRRARADQ